MHEKIEKYLNDEIEAEELLAEQQDFFRQIERMISNASSGILGNFEDFQIDVIQPIVALKSFLAEQEQQLQSDIRDGVPRETLQTELDYLSRSQQLIRNIENDLIELNKEF